MELSGLIGGGQTLNLTLTCNPNLQKFNLLFYSRQSTHFPNFMSIHSQRFEIAWYQTDKQTAENITFANLQQR